MRSNTRPSIRLYLLLTFTLIFLLIVCVAVLNLMLLPRMTERLGEAISSWTGETVEVGSVSYIPIRGIVVKDIGLRVGPPFGANGGIGRARFRIPLRLLKAVRRGITISETPDTGIVNRVSALAASVAEFLPGTLLLQDVHLLKTDSLTWSLEFDTIDLNHDHQLSSLSLSAFGDSADVSASLGYATADISIKLTSIDISISPAAVQSGRLEGALHFATLFNEIWIAGDLRVADLSLNIGSLSDQPLQGIDARYAFSAYVDPDASAAPPLLSKPLLEDEESGRGEAVITAGSLTVNEVRAELYGAYRGFAEWKGNSHRMAQLRFRLAKTPVQDILEAIPEAIVGDLSASRLLGSISYALDLDIPLDSISDLSWRADVSVDSFAVSSIPTSMNPYAINDSFLHTINDGSIGYSRTVLIPPARPASVEWMLEHSEHSRHWIETSRLEDISISSSRPEVKVIGPAGQAAARQPDSQYRYIFLDDMSPWVIRAILTAEDGDFFFYGGVNWITLIGAMERNIQAGEILYGASTISMQLAKMLFLDQKRIFSRKIQEVFLVYLMEHHVPVSKDRILELYINIAEFGPGIFGIYDASQYYFGKHPAALSAGEAAWLATIMPSPKTYHRYFEQWRITDEWFARMTGLFGIMLERGRMTAEEYQEATTVPPLFAPIEAVRQ